MTSSEIDQIIEATTEVTGITLLQMRSKVRFSEYVEARRIVMFLAREKGMTLKYIGDTLNRDHKTVMYGLEKMKNRGRGPSRLNRALVQVRQAVA